MRFQYGLSLLLVVALAGGYLYYLGGTICPIPLGYRLAELDDRFGISYQEARAAISDAEALWEDAAGRELFVYDEGGSVVVNFVFDTRQALTDAEENFRLSLDEQRELTEDVRNRYELLTSEYANLKAVYDRLSDSYESELNAYNNEVERWNREGGAPPEVFEQLEDQQRALGEEQEKLVATGSQLNELVNELNQIAAQGSQAIDSYNNSVQQYNNRFNESREFTQGDYSEEVINIYQFVDGEELRIVLAHEFGHALALDHVPDSEAIMHHQMGEQSLATGVKTDDITELTRVCGAEGESRFSLLWRTLVQ